MNQRTNPKMNKDIKSDNYCCRNGQKSDKYIWKQYRKEAMNQRTKSKQ